MIKSRSTIPTACTDAGILSREDLIHSIINMVLKDSELFGYVDHLGVPLFDAYYFYNMLMPKEQNIFNAILREGNRFSPDNVIALAGPIYFFNKFIKFTNNPDMFVYGKFLYYINNYLEQFDNYTLCSMNTILKTGNGMECKKNSNEHIILVDRNNQKVNMLRQKQSLGAPITIADIENLEDDKILSLTLDNNKNIYSEKFQNQLEIQNNKSIFDKAFEYRKYLQSIFPIENDISTENIDEQNKQTLKKIFKDDFNNNEQFELLLKTVMNYLNNIGMDYKKTQDNTKKTPDDTKKILDIVKNFLNPTQPSTQSTQSTQFYPSFGPYTPSPLDIPTKQISSSDNESTYYDPEEVINAPPSRSFSVFGKKILKSIKKSKKIKKTKKTKKSKKKDKVKTYIISKSKKNIKKIGNIRIIISRE